MTTPLIDERALVAMLDCTPTYEVVQRLQQGALYTLIDAFDRDITREAFFEAASAAASLIDALGRLALLHNIKMFAEENGPAGPKDLDHAMIGVQEMVDEATKRSIKMVELMRQCPMDEDQIH